MGELAKSTKESDVSASVQPISRHLAQASPKPLISLTVRQLYVLFAGALAILIVAVGYFVWYKPGRPDAVLARSLMSTMQLDSTQFMLAGQYGDNNFQLKGSGSAKGVFDVNGSYATKSGTVQLQALSSDGQDVYVKLNGLKSLGSLLGPQAAQYGISSTSNPFQSLDGSWLVISRDTKDSLLKSSNVGVGTASALSVADKKRLGEAYQRHPFVHVTARLADETVHGDPSRHFQAVIEKPELTAFLQDVRQSVPDLKLDDQKIASIQQAKLPTTPFDAWISAASGYISRLKTSGAKAEQGFQLDLSQYNQPVQATKPSGAKPLFDALSNALLGGGQ